MFADPSNGRKEAAESPRSAPAPVEPSQWLLKSLGDLKEEMAGAESRLGDQINGLNNRLGRIEKIAWTTIGGLAVIVFFTVLFVRPLFLLAVQKIMEAPPG